ncbi:MAG: 2-oxoacid:acceptor oxidoreductase subunit alpha, partial [Candidatus Methanofastidiosia archaeon]
EKVGFLRLKTLFPFPEIEKLCERKKIYVCEMNVGRISLEVERVTKEEVKTLSFVGGVVPRISEILRGVLDEK